MKLFKKQANFVLPMVSCYKTIIRHAKLLLLLQKITLTKQSSGTQNYLILFE